ncbi:MAG: hypothetical protein D3910_27790 [Candidatus Electrothrix sp. ATG2]|nr:hypothetical protein [Candidatus Electrothrix sp. ATG2]
MEPLTFYAGLLVARTLAPAFKNGYDFITNKEQKDESKRKNERLIAHDAKIELQKLTHQQRLKFAQEEFRKRREEKNMDTFYKECWPIRNPYEMKLSSELKPVSNDISLLGDYIVPCRIISALIDNIHL